MRRIVLFLGVMCLLLATPAQADGCNEKILARATLWSNPDLYQLDVVECWLQADPSAVPTPGERLQPFADMTEPELRIRCVAWCKHSLAFREPVDDGIIGAFVLNDASPDFITIWGGGTCYRVRIYRVEKDRIVKVMEESTKFYPSFVYDRDGETLIVLNNINSPVKRHTRRVSGQIWKFQSDRYVPIGK